MWLTEHHTASQCPSPAVAVAAVASATTRIRVGTAGVLLNLHPVAKVSDDFRTLMALFGGRLDFGVAGAVPDAATLQAYDQKIPPSIGEEYRDRIKRMIGLLRSPLILLIALVNKNHAL